MTKYNYFASPFHSPRARSFREAYGAATPGQDFWFENQPYAGPPVERSAPLQKPGPTTDFHSFPGSPPRFPAGIHGPTPPGYNYGMQNPGADVTGRYGKSGGLGLLTKEQEEEQRLYSDLLSSEMGSAPAPGRGDPITGSGWEKSDRFNHALAQMLFEWGVEQTREDPWYD